MPLTSGAKLGPFEILAPLGAGGMGEVYRAWDTRLERTVAIKVSPERLSHKPEERQQLENEARAISKLSHPHICTLHDIGHYEGRDFLVLELVDGQTLRGKRPFRRTTAADTLSATIHEEAEPISALNPEVPPPFCGVVERCLAKEPDHCSQSVFAAATEDRTVLRCAADLDPSAEVGIGMEWRS